VSWAEQQLSELIEFCSTPGQTPLPGTVYETFARAALQSTTLARSKSATATSLVTQLLTVDTRRSNRSDAEGRISLRKLINLCALQGVSVEQLLLDPLGSASLPLLDRWADYRPLELPSGHDAVRASVLNDCFETMMAEHGDLYLPHPRSAMREVKLTRRLAEKLCGDTYKSYVARYQEQGSISELHDLERIFQAALECVRTLLPNPFVRNDLKKARRTIARSTGISIDIALSAAKSVVLWRRVLERSKTRALCMSDQEVRAHKRLGGIAGEWC
jgi:hypothetical protein